MASWLNDLEARPMTSRVLVIDDDESVCESLRRLLSAHYVVSTESSGLDGLVAAQSAPRPSLILLDVRMPGMSGYEVLEALKRRPELASIPVVFITGMGAIEDEEKGLALGAADYITKPLQPNVVRARVATQVELARGRNRLERENAILEAKVQARVLDNEITQAATIAALAGLAEARDGDTGRHIARTQAYVRLLAEHLKSHPRFGHELTPVNIESIVKSAPLHDIGKVGVPDQILLKPGPLSGAQWPTMQRHAAMGAEALEGAERQVNRRLPFLHYAKQIARWHHERWDGQGYPDALAGEQIPIAARLMAVADVFDALVNARCYKPAMTFETAKAIMLEGRGTQFDPDVLDAFLAQFDAFKGIAEVQSNGVTTEA